MAQSTNLSDFKTEASVNSVSYILPPPPPLEYSSLNLAEAWRRWKNGYDTFYRLRNGDQIPEDKRIFLLLQALGSEAVSIYYDMDFDKEEDKMSHDAVLSRFAEKCAPRQHALVERHNFYQIARNTGESMCDLMDRVKPAARNCEFRDQTLNMVRDKLVLNYPDQAVKQRMMGETDISLDDMVKLALMFESIQSNCRTIDNSCDINLIANPTQTMVRDKNQKCRNCGRSHESVCPAKGQVCRRCGKKNHFERVCHAKSTINNLTSNNKDVVQIDTFDVTSEPVNKSFKWSCVFCINDGPSLTFKIDTGADVNTISCHHLKTVPNVIMRKSKIRLKPYGTKEFLQPLGVVELCLRHPYTKEYYKDDFFVIQDNAEALLGRHFCGRYNLVSLNIPKQLQQIQERTRKNHNLQPSTQHRILCPGSMVRFRIDNGWRKGKIKSNEGFRRYRVVTDDGQEFVRNRRFLFPTQSVEPWIQFTLASRIDSDHGLPSVVVPELRDNSSELNNPVQEFSESAIKTSRYGRIVKPPIRYGFD